MKNNPYKTIPHTYNRDIIRQANSYDEVPEFGTDMKERYELRCSKIFDRLMDNLSVKEVASIWMTPLVINDIIITYAGYAISLCVADRISEYKNTVRQIRSSIRDYHSRISLDLNCDYQRKINELSHKFIADNQGYLDLFFLTLNTMVKQDSRKLNYDIMRTNALMAEVLYRYVSRHNDEKRKLTESIAHAHNVQSYHPQICTIITHLRTLSANINVEKNPSFPTLMGILKNFSYNIFTEEELQNF